MRRSFAFAGLSSYLVLAMTGCGKETDELRVYPVTGKILVSGKPAEGVSVSFYADAAPPAGKKVPVPTGVSDANGDFQLTSYVRGDGAPAGTYKVSAVWDEKRPANVSGVFEPKDRLRGRYSSPQTSKLTAKVDEQATELPPFQL
ncbi:MAG: hypothetical protein U0805_04015 [Pirellulales bacterium]